MDKSNMYWAVYCTLEHEFLKIAEYISVEDTQLSVYSSKTADLLVRIAIEIESLSKYLFIKTGGAIPDGQRFAFFDTDCIKHLEKLWKIETKEVVLSCPYVYVSDDHRILSPLKDCSMRNHGRWKNAYQAVKHNRTDCMNEASVSALIEALAALFLLNVYNRDTKVDLGTDSNGHQFDTSLGSSVFSIEVHPYPGLDRSGVYQKNESFEKCTYLIHTSTGSEALCKTLRDLDKRVVETVKEHVLTILQQGRSIQEVDLQKLKSTAMLSMSRSNTKEVQELNAAISRLRYEAVLNKGQDLNITL